MRFKYRMILWAVLPLTNLMAHAPSKVEASFNQETRQLTVTFSHSVNDPENHYIDVITVFLDRKQILEQKFKSQPDIQGGEIVYTIRDAKPGDTLQVNVKCNKIGAKSISLKIE